MSFPQRESVPVRLVIPLLLQSNGVTLRIDRYSTESAEYVLAENAVDLLLEDMSQWFLVLYDHLLVPPGLIPELNGDFPPFGNGVPMSFGEGNLEFSG